METYEKFCYRNGGFNGGCNSEEVMRKNYAIALKVEKIYNENHPNTKEPQVGDIVEFADDYHVYKDAKIVEPHYCDGRLCVCENGGSFTDGKFFSTSGGAFVGKEKSELQYVGEDFNIVWTWGCYGSGGNQGIYFPLKVRRWKIPYDPKNVRRSTIRFEKNLYGRITSVSIRNSSELFDCMTFKSLRAFEAWAKYVGYEYRTENERGFSCQAINERCWTNWIPKPDSGKPIKVHANGDIHDGLVVTEDFAITNWWPNIPKPHFEYGSPEYEREREEQRRLYAKYAFNPMGI